jgi:hypothetical protein
LTWLKLMWSVTNNGEMMHLNFIIISCKEMYEEA